MAQKKKAKARPKPAAKSAKPAIAHKKMSVARKASRKAPVKHAARLVALFTAIALFVPGCNGGLNPFALQGSVPPIPQIPHSRSE